MRTLILTLSSDSRPDLSVFVEVLPTGLGEIALSDISAAITHLNQRLTFLERHTAPLPDQRLTPDQFKTWGTPYES